MTFTNSTWTKWNAIYTTTVTGTSNGITMVGPEPSSSTSGTTTAHTWTAWNRTFVVTTTIGNDTSRCSTSSTIILPDCWPAWNRSYGVTTSIADCMVGREAETPEQAQVREQRRVAERARWIEIEGERALARDRAQRILHENLTEAQREELALKGHFTLTVHAGEERRLYRIKRGRSRNVQRIDANGRVLGTLCAHPAIHCPDEDTMLAQKLMLETREPEFLRIANHS